MLKTTDNFSATAPSIPHRSHSQSPYRHQDITFLINGQCIGQNNTRTKLSLKEDKNKKTKEKHNEKQNSKLEDRFSNLFCNTTIRDKLRKLLADQAQSPVYIKTEGSLGKEKSSRREENSAESGQKQQPDEPKVEGANRCIRVKSFKLPTPRQGHQPSYRLRTTHTKTFHTNKITQKATTYRSIRSQRAKTEENGQPCILINPLKAAQAKKSTELTPHIPRDKKIYMHFKKFRKTSYAAITNPHALPPQLRVSTKKSASSAVCLTH